jgi:hypothetical protein
MLLGATILCFLVLLVLLADRASARLWRGGPEARMYRCAACDLRYPAADMHDPAFRLCPAGHLVVAEADRGSAASLVAIFTCVGFLVVALVMLLSGAGGSG